MIPPMETNAPRVRERHVTHGTRPSSKEELRRFFSFSLSEGVAEKGGVGCCSGCRGELVVGLLVKGFFMVRIYNNNGLEVFYV